MNFWVDMDGVLNKYIREDYRGSNPVFLHKGGHYYRYLEPDFSAIDMLKILKNHGFNIFIISKLPKDDDMFKEHYNDKVQWLRDNIPFINEYQFFPTVDSKSKAVISEYYRSDVFTLKQSDILIDDFNDNLIDWGKAGGTAIKYLNGVNSRESWNGYTINRGTFKKDIDYLLSVL